VHASSGAALAFCDADVFPTPGWLSAGVAALEAADLVQGHVLPDPGRPLGAFDRTLWITFEVGLWETASLFVSRETFDRTGGFQRWIDPKMGKDLAEDVWFGYKAQRLGARPAFCETALAYHAVFTRGWRDYVAERRRLRYFPAMAAKMPEMRDRFFYRRRFLNRRSALFDIGLAGVALAGATRSPLPLAAAVPYARALRDNSRRVPVTGLERVGIGIADLAADAVGVVALARGTLRYRALIL
jgi:hypothetical protein